MATQSMNTYTFGTTVEVRCRLVDPETKQPVTPGAITCVVQKPDGTQVSIGSSPRAYAGGLYGWSVIADQVGVWSYRVVTTDLLPSASEGKFYVRPSALS